jgi:hypothetical protein
MGLKATPTPPAMTVKSSAAKQKHEKNDEKDVHGYLQYIEVTLGARRSSNLPPAIVGHR